MRIALVHPFPWPEVRRGGERYVDDLARWLSGRGHDVDVLTGTHGRAGDELDGRLTMRRRRHRLPRPLAERGVRLDDTFGAVVLPALARRRYDVVHAMTPTGAIAARAARQRTVYTVLGHPTAAQLAARRGDRRLFAAAVRGSTVAAALSGPSADAVAALFGRRAEVLPPGIRLDAFPSRPSPAVGPVRVLFSAHLGDRRKGLPLLLGAFRRVLADDPSARLVLSGAGDPEWAFETLDDERAAVEAATERPGPGAPDEVAARYRDATVTVLPSSDEAFGLALVESLASGTPVVCTASGGMPEVVGTDGVGFVVPPGDAVALAGAIVSAATLARQPATIERCRDRARAFDWDLTVGPRHEAVYEQAARERVPASGLVRAWSS